MTDKKKPPSMRVAAATQKLTKAELDDLLKAAEAAASTEGEAAEDAADDGDAKPAQGAAKKKK